MKSLKILLILLFLFSSSIFYFTDSVTISLFFNNHHWDVLDRFFSFISCFGEKYFYIFIGALMLVVKKNKFLPFPLSFINFTIVVQFLKRVIFADHKRPSVALQQLLPEIELNLVPYISVEQDFSFPSGHATMIFSLIILFIYVFEVKNIFSQCMLIFFAILVAISRLYLLQHFFVDVYCGALIGSFMTFLTIYLFVQYDLNNKEPFRTLLRWVPW